MKKIIVSVLVFASMLFAGNMQNNHMGHAHVKVKHIKMFQSVPMNKATILQDGDAKMYCLSCGMTLPMFYRTNHAADHDHIHDQYCSITCMIEDGVVNGKKLSNFRVVDNTTLKFIPSKDAYFVIGSKNQVQ